MTKKEFELEALEAAREIRRLTGFPGFYTSRVFAIIRNRFANVIASGEEAERQQRQTAAWTEED